VSNKPAVYRLTHCGGVWRRSQEDIWLTGWHWRSSELCVSNCMLRWTADTSYLDGWPITSIFYYL